MIITLKDTEKLMESRNYKDRFIAEYWQTKIRYEKLKWLNTNIQASEEQNGGAITPIGGCPQNDPKYITAPVHDTPSHILSRQETHMECYLRDLEVRAVFENIDISLDHMIEIADAQRLRTNRYENDTNKLREYSEGEGDVKWSNTCQSKN